MIRKAAIVMTLLLVTSVVFAGGGSEQAATTGRQFVTIGTGGITGLYYPTGGAVARMLNAKPEYGIRATVESTGGSVFNINAVLSGDLEFGIAQSDRQYQALKGLAEWESLGPQTELRSMFSIHPEAITLVASVESGITEIRDLAGRSVNIGNPGSGFLQNALDAIEAFGVDQSQIRAEQVPALEGPGLLQDGRIDAFFYTVGHPSGAITEATSGRIPVRIVNIDGPELDALLREYPYYGRAVIPRALYPQAENTQDVRTFGVLATFVTSSRVSDDIVYALTKEVFDNLDQFKALHPAYQALTAETMLAGMSAPVHAGALRYFRESGLIQHVDPSLVQ